MIPKATPFWTRLWRRIFVCPKGHDWIAVFEHPRMAVVCRECLTVSPGWETGGIPETLLHHAKG
jgi:hypothetical protein